MQSICVRALANVFHDNMKMFSYFTALNFIEIQNRALAATAAAVHFVNNKSSNNDEMWRILLLIKWWQAVCIRSAIRGHIHIVYAFNSQCLIFSLPHFVCLSVDLSAIFRWLGGQSNKTMHNEVLHWKQWTVRKVCRFIKIPKINNTHTLKYRVYKNVYNNNKSRNRKRLTLSNWNRKKKHHTQCCFS